MPTSALAALLHIPGLIHHQHPARVTQILRHITADVIPDAVSVPAGPRQQVPHTGRAGVPPRARRWSSSLPAAGLPASPARRPAPAAAAQPCGNEPPHPASDHRKYPASGHGLRCGQRPPQDHHASSQTMIIKRWPSHAQPFPLEITIYCWSTNRPVVISPMSARFADGHDPRLAASRCMQRHVRATSRRLARSFADRGMGWRRSWRGFVLRSPIRSPDRCLGRRVRLAPRRSRCCAAGAATRPDR